MQFTVHGSHLMIVDGDPSDEDRASAHATGRCDGGDEGRQCGHDDFHRDFQDFFLFVVHSSKI